MSTSRPIPATRFLAVLLLLLAAAPAASQRRPPILDMHLHAMAADAQGPPPLAMCTPMRFAAWDPAQPYGEVFMRLQKAPPCDDPVWSPETDDELLRRTVAAMERRNVIGVLSGAPEEVATWHAAAPDRFIRGLILQIGDPRHEHSVDSLRALHRAGRLDVLGEVITQYAGIAPDDPRLEPYWALAEELDIPVGIHVGTGPPGAIYLGAEQYRGRLHSALTMEEVLVRHPRLRVYLMHAGYPLIDDLLTLLYAHPQVHVDVGIIAYSQPRPAFYGFLRSMIDHGFLDRVMFGSDQMIWPETIERAIDVIEEAPFLEASQKRAILYDNAARFLRVSDVEIERHWRM